MIVLVIFVIAMTKYFTGSNWRGGRVFFFWLYFEKGYHGREGRLSEWPGCEAAEHRESTVISQRERNTGVG